MLRLYTSPHCQYCKRVETFLLANAIDHETCDITHPEHRDTLITLGGKMQIPFLVDPEAGVHMYESDDIIAYVAAHYSAQPRTEAASRHAHTD